MHSVESKSDKIIDLNIIFGQKAQGYPALLLSQKLDNLEKNCYNTLKDQTPRRLL
jgi:hypothetical protein